MRLKEGENTQEIVTKFDGTNYSEWSSQIKFRLMEKGLWNHVTEDPLTKKGSESAEDFKKRVTAAVKLDDQKALGIIGRSIKADFTESIGQAETAAQAWKSLQQIYESNSAGSLMTCRSEFYNLRMDEKEDLVSYLGKLEKIQRLCKKSKAPINDEELIVKVVHSLPKSFDSFCQGLRSNRNLLDSYQVIKEQLLSEWQARGLIQISNVDEKRAFNSERKSGKFKFKCFNCDKPGHKKADCWAKGGDKEGKGPKSSKEAAKAEKREEKEEKVAFVTKMTQSYAEVAKGVKLEAFSASKNQEDHVWIVDSGATDHMVRDAQSLKRVQQSKEKVRIADDTFISTKGVGSMECIGEGGKRLEIKNVWHVPNLGRNLLSVAAIDKSGFKVEFFQGQVQIMNENGHVVTRGLLDEKSGLYKINLESIGKSTYLARSNTDINLWHRRLGHLNFQSLKEIGIEFNGKQEFCGSCVEGKMARLPFSREKTRNTLHLECLNMDLMGPMETPGLNGERFVLCISDESSGYTVVEPLQTKEKGRVMKYAEDFISLMENQTSYKVKKIRCDGGGEFVNSDMMDLCAKKGIILDSSNPYTPQQNGISERKNRTIIEMARSMLKFAGLPNEFWPQSVCTAAYIRNRCPGKDNKSPLEKLLGTKPDYKRLKIFGCHCYVHVPKELRKKLDSKAKLCILVGYSTNGYKLFNLKDRKFVWSRDVIFNEEEFGEQVQKDLSQLDSEDEGFEDFTSDSDSTDQERNSVKEDDSSDQENRLDEGNSGRRVTRSMARTQNAELQIYMASGNSCSEPRTFQEAISSEDAEEWRMAMDQEIKSLAKNQTWELCELPQGKKSIGSKWVYRVKVDENGKKVKLKARLVVQGFKQRQGIDYSETFAPVVRLESLRILLALKAIKGWKSFQLDVKTAFLYGDIDREIYMAQPQGYVEKGREHLVCHLKRSLYGLKQAPRIWNQEITNTLKSLGFVQTRSDNGVFILDQQGRFIILGLWVDDIPGFYVREEDRDWLVCSLKEKYEITDEGDLTYILGTLISKSHDGSLSISQKSYIQNKTEEFGVDDARQEYTPMVAGQDLKDSSPIVGAPYREIVGSLMHVMVNTRPDIAYAVSILSRNLEEPTRGHWIAAKRVLKYLKTTSEFELKYARTDKLDIEVFVDSNDGGGRDGIEKPTFGYVIKIAGGAVVWKSRKLDRGTLSTAESEFLGLTQAAQDVEWVRELLTELGQDVDKPTQVWEDNQACIKIAKNPVNQGRTKHLGRRVGFVRDALELEIIQLDYLPTDDMIADIFTKALPRQKFEKFRAHLGLVASSGSVG
jgi:hypothetical protein